MKIFVETDSDIRLARRLRRDIAERGRELEGVLKQYNKFVKPAFDYYIEPTMSHADIIVPRGKGLCLLDKFISQQLFMRFWNTGTWSVDCVLNIEWKLHVFGFISFYRGREPGSHWSHCSPRSYAASEGKC